MLIKIPLDIWLIYELIEFRKRQTEAFCPSEKFQILQIKTVWRHNNTASSLTYRISLTRTSHILIIHPPVQYTRWITKICLSWKELVIQRLYAEKKNGFFVFVFCPAQRVTVFRSRTIQQQRQIIKRKLYGTVKLSLYLMLWRRMGALSSPFSSCGLCLLYRIPFISQSKVDNKFVLPMSKFSNYRAILGPCNGWLTP